MVERIVRSLVPCSLFALIGLASPADAEDLPALAFLQKTTPKDAPTFAWPEATAFARAWSSAPRLVRIAEVDLPRVRIGDEPMAVTGVLLSFWPSADGRLEVRVEAAPHQLAWDLERTVGGGGATWRITQGALATGRLVLVSSERSEDDVLDLVVRYISPLVPIAPGPRADFAYVTTLLTAEGSAYEPPPERWDGREPDPKLTARWKKVERLYASEERDVVERELTALLGSDTPRTSDQWADAAEWARKQAPELAIRIYRHWIPVGRCSMDTRPQAVARDYAELCFERGRLGCFLDLQVQIMGNQFSRRAWSSMGERAHRTESARLLSAGIDVERFFRGLVVRYAIDGDAGRELPTWRLGKAAAEATNADLGPTFERQIEDESLDELNRFRAASTLLDMVPIEKREAHGAALDHLAHLRTPPSVERLVALRRAELAARAPERSE